MFRKQGIFEGRFLVGRIGFIRGENRTHGIDDVVGHGTDHAGASRLALRRFVSFVTPMYIKQIIVKFFPDIKITISIS